MVLCWSPLAITSSDELLAAGDADGLSGRISTQPMSARGGIL